jgi:hypothetical protein
MKISQELTKGATFFEIDLPKWPALVVVGKPVTREQAMQILIRTDDLYFSTNDRIWDKQLNEYFYDLTIDEAGYNSDTDAIRKKLNLPKDGGWNEIYEYQNSYTSAVKSISLSYLKNQRIGSSWIGGPHGWCDWRGNIHSCNYNIGKWPTVPEIYNEWEKIAKAFPFLDLTCQLMGHEAGEEDTAVNPVIQFRIKGGKVKMSIPKKPIAIPAFGSDDMISRFSNPHAERGCTFDQFKEAVDYTRNLFKTK